MRETAVGAHPFSQSARKGWGSGLPLGSSDVRVSSIGSEPFFSGTGEAKLEQGVTVLRIDLGMSLERPGKYLLQVRRTPSNGFRSRCKYGSTAALWVYRMNERAVLNAKSILAFVLVGCILVFDCPFARAKSKAIVFEHVNI